MKSLFYKYIAPHGRCEFVVIGNTFCICLNVTYSGKKMISQETFSFKDMEMAVKTFRVWDGIIRQVAGIRMLTPIGAVKSVKRGSYLIKH